MYPFFALGGMEGELKGRELSGGRKEGEGTYWSDHWAVGKAAMSSWEYEDMMHISRE